MITFASTWDSPKRKAKKRNVKKQWKCTKNYKEEKMTESPVYNVKKVPIEKIHANAYNPNSVAPPEMRLLYESIREDGYTMPIVCYYCL